MNEKEMEWWMRLAKLLHRIEDTVYEDLADEAVWLQDNFPGDE